MNGDKAVEYAKGSQYALREITDSVKPELIIHGHHHKRVSYDVTLEDSKGETYRMKSVCLDKEYSSEGNLMMLDIATKEISTIKV